MKSLDAIIDVLDVVFRLDSQVGKRKKSQIDRPKGKRSYLFSTYNLRKLVVSRSLKASQRLQMLDHDVEASHRDSGGRRYLRIINPYCNFGDAGETSSQVEIERH